MKLLLLPKGPFDLLLADPPWKYKDNKGDNPAMGGCKYPKMTLLELVAMGHEVKSITAKPAALAIWVTAPFSAEGAHILVAEAWGFNLVTLAFVWVKTNRCTPYTKKFCLDASQEKGGDLYSGLGHHVNGNVELCYLGFNSSPRLPRMSKSVKQIIIAPLNEHSAKPPECRRRLEELFGDTRRLELFSRERVPGWMPWGNEVPDAIKTNG